MSNLSECVIKFCDSSAYQRFILSLDGLAIFFVLTCGLSLWVKSALILMMLMMALRTYRDPKPYSKWDILILRVGACAMMCKNQTVERYTQCRVLVNCGLFFLLELSGDNARRVLVVFFDQIELDCYRTICFIEKIQ